MQNLIPKLKQRSIIFKKPGFLSENLKTLTSSNYHRVGAYSYLLLNFCTLFLLNNVYKSMFNFFIFSLDLRLLMKLLETGVYKPGLFNFLQIAQDVNKIKKYRTPFCRHW